MHAPNPQPEAAVCAVTRGNIRKLAATAFIALIVVFAVASNNGIQRRTVRWRRALLSTTSEQYAPTIAAKAFSTVRGSSTKSDT
jgi:hypothetical protein